MGMKELKAELEDEVSTILASDFTIQVTTTASVPRPDDPSITFPNLDERWQGAKLIETCVLYIDVRRSTDLNLTHKAVTVAKLYSAFIRAMTRVARHHTGHVRGIIGDRLMVIFDAPNAFVQAVECAISMNTVSKHIIDKHFQHNTIKCGIGIDAGKMLATKTGVRRHGGEQANYRSLVWLGRPANIASKLTDVANKAAEMVDVPIVHVAFPTYPNALLGALSNLSPRPNSLLNMAHASSLQGLFGALGSQSSPSAGALDGIFAALQARGEPSSSWRWEQQSLERFLNDLEVKHGPTRIVHRNPDFQSFYISSEAVQVRPATPPILMTKAVWDGYRKAMPNGVVVTKPLLHTVNVNVPGYDGEVFGGDVIFPDLQG
jgi:class 3 adenylate cyclase